MNHLQPTSFPSFNLMNGLGLISTIYPVSSMHLSQNRLVTPLKNSTQPSDTILPFRKTLDPALLQKRQLPETSESGSGSAISILTEAQLTCAEQLGVDPTECNEHGVFTNRNSYVSNAILTKLKAESWADVTPDMLTTLLDLRISSPIPLKDDDLNGLNHLEKLRIECPQISERSLSELTNLHRLTLQLSIVQENDLSLLPNLKELSLSVPTLPLHVFSKLSHLNLLTLNISVLQQNRLLGLTHLQTLTLKTDYIEEDGLRGLSNLKTLTLDVYTIPLNTFQWLSSLISLNIKGSHTHLPVGVFNGLCRLEELELSLTNPIENNFQGLGNLKTLKLSFSSLSMGTFQGLDNLKHLVLDGDLNLHENAFLGLSKLKTLETWMTSPSNSTFRGLSELENIKLGVGWVFWHTDPPLALPLDFFDGLDSIKNILMSANFDFLPKESIEHLCSLESFHIDGFYYLSIDHGAFIGLPNLNSVIITGDEESLSMYESTYQFIMSLPEHRIENNYLNIKDEPTTTSSALPPSLCLSSIVKPTIQPTRSSIIECPILDTSLYTSSIFTSPQPTKTSALESITITETSTSISQQKILPTSTPIPKDSPEPEHKNLHPKSDYPTPIAISFGFSGIILFLILISIFFISKRKPRSRAEETIVSTVYLNRDILETQDLEKQDLSKTSSQVSLQNNQDPPPSYKDLSTHSHPLQKDTPL